MRWIAMMLIAGACGRFGYEERSLVDAGPEVDASRDAAPDGPAPDVLAACPAGTAELSTGSSVCIELTERGNGPWTEGVSACQAAGRRLCADAEWFEACTSAVGVSDLLDGAYEWVAEETGGIAQKRGPDDCATMAVHAIVDPYEYRCCVDR